MSRICLVPQTVILLAAMTLPCCCYGQPSGPVSFPFLGTLQPIDLTLTNPYSGEVVRFVGDGTQANVNNSSYVGGNNFDSINMTNIADALFIRDELDLQVVINVEVYFSGQGNDLIQLADPSFVLNELTILGSGGDDVLWSNIEDDVVLGEGGNDHLVGGPGNDRLEGGNDQDYIGGGVGDDTLNGGRGNDELVGGPGADKYITGLDNDIIREISGLELNVIHLQNGLLLDDLTFEVQGVDLLIYYPDGLGQVTIAGQFLSPISGIDQIIADNGNGEILDLRAMFIPEPTSAVIALAMVLVGTLPRQRF